MKNKNLTINIQIPVVLLSLIFAFTTHQITQASSEAINRVNALQEMAKERNARIERLDRMAKNFVNSNKQPIDVEGEDLVSKLFGTQKIFSIKAEIDKKGVRASTGWDFELQNKWQNGIIAIRLYSYNEKTKREKILLQATLYPFEKVRADLLSYKYEKLFVDVFFDKNNKLLMNRASLNPRNAPYKTIYLTFGEDGSIYPQTGIYHGLTQTTDSGLDNSQNIPQSAVTYQTFEK